MCSQSIYDTALYLMLLCSVNEYNHRRPIFSLIDKTVRSPVPDNIIHLLTFYFRLISAAGRDFCSGNVMHLPLRIQCGAGTFVLLVAGRQY